MRRGPVFWLHLSFWLGAIIDLGAGLVMLFPALFAWMNKPVSFSPGIDFRYAMGMGAPLMFAWSILLLWADRQPIARRGILLITLLVVAGEALTQAWGVVVGFIPLGAVLPSFILQAILVAVFGTGLVMARQVAGRDVNDVAR